MSHVIFWFSGTGNTRALVQCVSEQLPGTMLVPMVTAVGDEAAAADTVGIAFPVYYFGLPLYVLDFLRRVTIPRDAFVYTLATMGGSSGVAHQEAAARLSERGLALGAGWSVKMPGNYTPLYGAPSARAQERCFAAMPDRAAQIAAAVAKRQPGPLEDSLLPLRLVSPLFRCVGVKRTPHADQAFRVSDHCTSCGVCERVCPVQNIRLEEGRPTWLGHCEQCMACLQWCPVEAVEAGWITRGRTRYHHPAFTAEDFMLRDDLASSSSSPAPTV